MENTNIQLSQYDKQLAEHQEKFLELLNSAGLPSIGIFVPIQERVVVFSNARSLLDRMDDEARSNAVYVSKFFAAVSAGLFDAALNYIWNETVLHLRKRIEAYDLEYFYEIAASEDKRKDLKTIEDISKLTDDELLRGSLKIDLISETGYRNIDLVKYMRNNASAAHPNQLDITGLKLISMAEDCLKEVISTPIPPAAIAVQQLLSNIKTFPLSLKDAGDVAVHFPDMGPDRTQRLAKGLFGIFYKRETIEPIRQNIRFLAPLLWPFVDEDTRKYFGIRHAFFSANNHVAEKKFAREFLNVVDGLSYITDQQRAVEVLTIIDELENAHNGFNNFYNEVLPAKRLLSIIGNPPTVPVGAESRYVSSLVKVFLTNGYGTADSANIIYLELISNFTPKQAVFAAALVFDEVISSKLRIPRCEDKYYEMIGLLEQKISTHAARQLITEINSRKYKLGEMRLNRVFKSLADTALTEIK
jgi:hypothetical protein